ncbi:protein of unknown function [Pararobbsia alpina]
MQAGEHVTQVTQPVEQGHIADHGLDAQTQAAYRWRIGRDEIAKRIHFTHNCTALLIDLPPHGRRLERLGIAIEQLDAKRFFKALHATRDRRLSQRQSLRRNAQRLTAYDRHEGINVIEFHFKALALAHESDTGTHPAAPMSMPGNSRRGAQPQARINKRGL